MTLSRMLHGKAGISAAMAIRLATALGTTPDGARRNYFSQ
jgi:plasmid maintenance system antidote protein VapI